ncbi:MAG: protein kinase [Verrucomicrobia bacterium]|nr:protein kinase [Verrucomicrobiota bacterium]
MNEQDLFSKATAIHDAEDRAAFLQAACDGNPELRRKVDAYLAEGPTEAGPSGNLDFNKLPPRMEDTRGFETPGYQIGPYKLLEKLGEGGFGSVWAAEQREPVRRRVALKIIKLGMDTQQVVARFEAERQALAMMDHPNIAKVLDAGATETGRPFFAMELVKGVPITRYCDEFQMGAVGRLELFIKVCQAIQHAHQKGIIHRDIKPSNVLVTLHDGEPVPKVIDFGISKATHQELTERTVYTQHSQFMGTPAYMSPEQAGTSGLDIDTRSDIYSLGVLLYELLTGRTPLDSNTLMSAGYDEMLRRIKEEEPTKPSTKISSLNRQERAVIAGKRKLDADQLSRFLRGELDWIVLKTLEKDRTRRYETANALASDIRRYLDNEPVLAVAPSVFYKVRKFAQRNKLAFAAGAAVTVALLGGLGLSIFSFAREKQARELAERSEGEAIEARKEVELQRDDADRARRLAVQNQKDAEAARSTAERLKAQFQKHAYQSDMSLASQSFNEGRLEAMYTLLNTHWPNPWETDLRAWEWYHLWQAGQRDRARTSVVGPVRELLVTPDNTKIVSLSYPSEVFIWKPPGFELIKRLRAKAADSPAAITPDGAFLLFEASDPGVIHRYDLFEGTDWEPTPLPAPIPGRITSMAFSPSEPLMAASVATETIVFWNTDTWEPVRPFLECGGQVHDITFDSSGRSLYAALNDSRILIWNLADGTLRKTLREHSESVSTLAVSPVSDTWVSGGRDDVLLLWNGDSEVVGRYYLGGDIHDLVFSKDGSRLLVGTSSQNSMLVYEVQSTPPGLRLTQSIKGHSKEINGLAFGKDFKTAYSGGEDSYLKEWNLKYGEPFISLDPIPGASHLFFAADRKELLIAPEVGDVYRWDTGAERLMEPLDSANGLRALASSPEGNLIAGTTSDGLLACWNRRGDRVQTANLPAPPTIRRLCISETGPTAIWTSPEGVHSWNFETQEGRMIPIGNVDVVPVLSPSGQHVVVCQFMNTRAYDISNDPPVRLWDVSGWGPEYCATYSPDGSQVAIGSYNNNIRIHDAQSGQLLQNIRGHTKPVISVAYSGDGRRLASGSDDQTVRIWDPAPGRLLATLTGHRAQVKSVAWMAETHSLASLDQAGYVKIWTAADPEEIHMSPSELDKRVVQCLELQDWAHAGLFAEEVHQIRANDPILWMKEAALLALGGLSADYQAISSEMARRFGGSQELAVTEKLCKTRLVIPPKEEDVQAVMDLAHRTVSDPEHWILPWGTFVMGLAEYRLGNYSEARRWSLQCIEGAEAGAWRMLHAHVVLAMSEFQMDHAEAASNALLKAETLLNQNENAVFGFGEQWHDGVFYEVLKREAEQLIRGGA